MTIPLIDPVRQAAFLRKLVSAARAVVTYEVGLPIGAARVRRLLSVTICDPAISSAIFVEYLGAIGELPHDSVRLEWSRSVLLKLDKELERTNQLYRDAVFDACYRIIDRFAGSRRRAALPPDPTPKPTVSVS